KVTKLTIIAKVPGQGPVLRRTNRDSRLVTRAALLLDLVYLVKHLESIAPRVRVDIDVVFIIVVIVAEVDIDSLVAAYRQHQDSHHRKQTQIFAQLLVYPLNGVTTAERQGHEEIQH